MPYCTQQDLVVRYGELELIQLTDREGLLGAIDTAVLNAALADASAEIDAYLRDGGYAIPLAQVPQTLTRHACQMARHYLYDGLRPEQVQKDYQESLRWLERVAAGQVRLTESRTDPRCAAGTRTMIYGSDFDATYSL